MNGVRKKYDEEFKKNAVKLSYVSPKTISELCEDLGISDSMLYHWRQQYTSQGKVKTFIGTSENALRIQIWTALISMLVIKWLHHLSQAPWSFSNMATMLRLNLFTYRDLRAGLDEPYETPPLVPRPEQLNLNMQRLGQPVSFSRGSRLEDLVSNPSKLDFQTVANTRGRFRFRAILDSSAVQ